MGFMPCIRPVTDTAATHVRSEGPQRSRSHYHRNRNRIRNRNGNWSGNLLLFGKPISHNCERIALRVAGWRVSKANSGISNVVIGNLESRKAKLSAEWRGQFHSKWRQMAYHLSLWPNIIHRHRPWAGKITLLPQEVSQIIWNFF